MSVRYLVAKPRKNGVRYYWQPWKPLREAGFLPRPLSRDLADAIKDAEALNARVDAYYAGQAPEVIRADSVKALIRLYTGDDAFKRLRDRTQRDYHYYLGKIERWCGDAPVKELSRKLIKAWYRGMVENNGPSFASHAVAVLKTLLAFAADEEWIDRNPAEKLRVKGSDGRTQVWSDSQVRKIVQVAQAQERPSVALAVMLAWCIGQRQGDVLMLPWSAYDGRTITLRQSKTGSTLPPIPVLHELKVLLDAAPRSGVQMVTSEETGKPYKSDNFQHVFAELRERAELPKELWFADLRRTVATALGRAGCTDDQIRAVTGHKTRSVVQVYVRPDGQYAEAAIAKLRVARRNAKRA